MLISKNVKIMYADFINLSLAGGIFFWDKTTNSTSLFTFIVDFVFVIPIQTSFFSFLELGEGELLEPASKIHVK